MQDIKNTIEEYRESREILQSRIHELNAIIREGVVREEDVSIKKLMERRYAMYVEIWDIDYAIRELCEYVRATGGLEVAQNAG